MEKNDSQQPIPLRVLGYEEDGEWLAHCLETDLVGTGKTFEEAFSALREMTAVQLGFALFKGQLALFHRPAPAWVVESYGRSVDEAIEQLGKKTTEPLKRKVSMFHLPDQQGEEPFALANA